MPVRVTIEVGGLCMFVKRTTDPKGLWILMPDMTTYAPRPHCALLIVPHALQGGHDRTMYSIARKDVSLAKPGWGTGKPVTKPPYLFEASAYAGNVGVDPKCFTAALDSALIARVLLPLGTTIDTSNSEIGDAETGGQAIQTVGVAHATFDIPDGTSLEIPVEGVPGGTVMVPPVNGDIRISILNVPRAYVNFPDPIGHNAGDMFHHPHAYYTLLRGTCGVDKKCPDIKATKAVKGKPAPASGPCVAQPTELAPKDRHQLAPFFIEPINCSVGWGCPDNQAC